MLDDSLVEERIATLCDRFTAEELVDLLGLSTLDICEKFRDDILDIREEEIYD